MFSVDDIHRDIFGEDFVLDENTDEKTTDRLVADWLIDKGHFGSMVLCDTDGEPVAIEIELTSSTFLFCTMSGSLIYHNYDEHTAGFLHSLPISHGIRMYLENRMYDEYLYGLTQDEQ